MNPTHVAWRGQQKGRATPRPPPAPLPPAPRAGGRDARAAALWSHGELGTAAQRPALHSLARDDDRSVPVARVRRRRRRLGAVPSVCLLLLCTCGALWGLASLLALVASPPSMSLPWSASTRKPVGKWTGRVALSEEEARLLLLVRPNWRRAEERGGGDRRRSDDAVDGARRMPRADEVRDDAGAVTAPLMFTAEHKCSFPDLFGSMLSNAPAADEESGFGRVRALLAEQRVALWGDDRWEERRLGDVCLPFLSEWLTDARERERQAPLWLHSLY